MLKNRRLRKNEDNVIINLLVIMDPRRTSKASTSPYKVKPMGPSELFEMYLKSQNGKTIKTAPPSGVAGSSVGSTPDSKVSHPKP